MGIFYTPPLIAVTESLSVSVSNIYNASFSFNLAPFVSRRYIVPDRVFFNASGTPQEFSTSTTPQSFPEWHTTYHPATWQDPWKSADLAADATFGFPQILQLPQALSANLPARTVLIAAMNVAPNYNISLRAYTTEENLLTSTAVGFPMVISSPGILKPFSMLHSGGKVFFLYVNFSDSRIHMKTYDGSVLDEQIFSNTDLDAAFGVAGCTFKHNSEEYIALTYARSTSEISIVTFKPDEFPNTATFTLNIGTFDSFSVPITHNPRTGIFALTWTDLAGNAYHKSGTMTSPGNFSFSATSPPFGGNFERNLSSSILSLNNFENSIVVPAKNAVNKMSSYFLHGSNPPTLAKDFATTGYTAQFPYFSNGTHYLGLLRLTGFKTFNLHRRPLPFPTDNWWQIDNKTLHIEGPPQLNSQVTIEVDFANVNAAESTAKTVNAGTVGGFRSLTSGYRVLRDTSNQFRIKFDKNMRVASYSEIIGTNTPIRLLDAANNPVSIVHDGGTSNEIYFKPVANLDFNSTYTITIASDVIDANGSQIYEDRQISFVTQNTSSQVAADEVASISLYTSPSYDAASRLNSGDEINASATIYIAVETAVDPAFNTIDTTTTSVYLNGSATPQGTVTLTETAANSKTFRGSYTVSTPTGGNHVFRFQTIRNDVYLDLSCGFPTISSVSPAAAAIGTLINSQPQIVFSENIKSSTVNASNIKLTRSGTLAGYSVSGSGNSITIDPDDTIEGLLRTETQYQIEAGYGITDLAGNPFVNVPATFTSTFTTQASQTQPISVNTVKLYSDAGLTSQLAADADYYGTGTVYIKFEASDGQALTRDSTTATLSTGQTAVLTETASSTGIFVGQSSFSGLAHNFQLKVSSTVTPSASASLRITWPGLTPLAPASAAINVPLDSTLRIQADEALNSTLVTTGNIITRQNGSIVATNVSYNGALREISIVPTALFESDKIYTVEVRNQTDLFGNPQRSALLYSFTTEDKISPTLTSFYPANAATGVTIDQQPFFIFSKNILAASVNKASVKLTRGGVLASYTLSVSSNRITIDPDDAADGLLKTETTYSIELNNGITDLVGNPFSNVPAVFTSTFTTQASQTQPILVSSVSLYSDAGFSSLLSSDADYYNTGTVYIRFVAQDGQPLTRDSTTATISTGQTAVLTETASSTGIFVGQTSFSGLTHNFQLKVASTVTPAASAALKITWPGLTPSAPASGAINVPLNSALRIQADEALNSALVTTGNIITRQNGSVVATNVSYNSVLREISIVPTALLESEKAYTVEVRNQADLFGNPQRSLLVYSFVTEDKTPPTLVSFYPANAAAGVTIDQQPYFTFSENILAASVNKTSVKLTRGGVLASYTFVVSGNRITIDPDDSPDSWLKTATSYSIELNSGVTDMSGNGLANVPEPFQTSFSTQPTITLPTDLDNISLYKDPLLITSWGMAEKIPASATVHIKLTGTDGATQTRDLASVTLKTGWGSNYEFAVQESASNSSGIYIGSFSFNSIPLYGVPTPLPTASSGNLNFLATQKPVTAATLSVAFPELYGSETTVTTTSGTATASGTTNVRVDSAINLSFSEPLANAGSNAALNLSSGGMTVPVARSLSADGKQITLTPAAPLPFGSEFLVSAIYSDSGLKSTLGNPLFRPFAFKFTTQAAQAQPTSVSSINLYPTADMSPLRLYVTDQDFNATGTIYIEAIGADSSANTVDTTSVTVSTGQTVVLTETTDSSGIFQGSLAYSNLSDGFVMRVTSLVSPEASQSLTLSFPKLTPSLPASGATGVSFATPVRIQASEELDSTTVNSGNVRLLQGGNAIAGTVSYLGAQRLIEFTPAQNLEFSKTYLLQISNIRDLVGNPVLKPFAMSFTTQSTSVPPTSVNTIKIFSDSAYQNQLAEGSLVAPAADVFIEVTAGDLSATTIDTTEILMTTDISANSRTTTLLETAFNSGIFQGMVTVFSDEDATLTFSSTTTPAVRATLKTLKMPKFTSLTPASGKTNLFLDSVFSIEGSKPFDAATINKSNIILAGSSGPASFSITQPAPNRLSLKTSLSISAELFLKLTSAIKDTDGLPYPELIASYSTLTPTIKELRLYADAAMTQPLADLAEVEMGKTVYLSIIASNAYLNEPETATATWSDETATFSISLTEASPGEFNGSLTVPQSPEKLLTMAPESRPDLIRYLRITRGFALESFSPASGAVNVPADVWPSWNFTRPVEPTDLSAGNFSLIRISDNTTVPVTIRRSLSGMQVRLEPAGVLPLLTVFEMRLSGSVRDTSGNALGSSLATRFSTQPPPPPPTEIVSLRNYETSDYATPTLAVANNDNLYLEMVAKDTSFSTYETARVRVESSDSSLDGLELTLVEIAPPSGVYRLALPINLPVGTTIKIQSQASPGMVINLTAYLRTRLLGISPASGSTGLYLDQPFSFNFSAAITSSTLAGGIQIFSAGGQQIPADFSVSNAGKTVTFTPQTAFVTGSSHQIIINTSLRDANGLFLLPETALFSTRSETAASFELLTGLAPLAGQKVSLTGEAVRGAISILASTTEMFANASDTRVFRFSAGSQVLDVILQETTPGSFAGNSDLAAFSGSSLQGSLLFAGNPTTSFALASEPEIVTVTPASGSSGIDEVVQPAATFSRKMAYDSGDGALRIESAAGTINTVQHGPATDSTALNWRLTAPLPVEASCTLRLSGLTDYLGQPLADYQHTFSTGGRQGINLYSENSFAQLIASETINLPIIFCEIAASGTLYLSDRSFFLEAKRGTRATETIRLPVEPASTTSGLYRCSLAISESRAVPQHSLQLFPGEWLEITSPELTSDKKLLYYRNAGSTTPTQINDLRFFADRHYARRIYDKLESPALFIEIDAEDQNWFTVDKTAVKVTSDADPVGFDLNLVETAAHSNIFRAAIRLNSLRSDPAAGNLKVAPGQRIQVVSLADSSVQSSIRYVPENSIKNIAVYPSPARGDTVTFRFYLNFASDVHLEIYDTAGDKIKGFVIRAREGDNDFRWRLPSHLANGVYFYRMEIDKDPQTPAGKRKGRGKFAVLR